MAKGGKPGSGGGGGSASKTIIKGTRDDDRIVIGEFPHDGYSDATITNGFVLSGWAGNDVLSGGSGADQLIGGAGDDWLVGAIDDLVGAPAATLVYDGGHGNDTIDFSNVNQNIGVDLFVENDRILLGLEMETTGGLDRRISWSSSHDGALSGVENIIGGSGNDYIRGDWQDNRLEGGAGDDYIEGSAGNDVLIGGAGDDLLSAGWGNNILTGNSGNDVFAITGRVSGQYVHNVITDFETYSGNGDASFDQIWLWQGWSIQWIESATGPLRGYLLDGSTIFGEITIDNLSYADRGLVPVYAVDSATGDPVIDAGYAAGDFFVG